MTNSPIFVSIQQKSCLRVGRDGGFCGTLSGGSWSFHCSPFSHKVLEVTGEDTMRQFWGGLRRKQQKLKIRSSSETWRS